MMVPSSHVRARAADAAFSASDRADPASMPAGWWLVPAFIAGLGLIGAAVAFCGLLVTFGGMALLSGLSAFVAARLSARAAR